MGQATASFSTATYPYVDPLVVSDVNSRGGIMSGAAAGIVKRGTLLEISGTKWIPAATTAAGILADDCDATTGDASCVVYVGGVFMASGIIWGPLAHPAATEALRDVGIQLQSVMSQVGTMVKGAPLPSETVRVDDTVITKDLKPKEILTDHGAIPVTTGETDKSEKSGSLDPHPAPLRVPPGETEAPTEDDDEPKDKHKHHQSPPPKSDKPEPGNSKK